MEAWKDELYHHGIIGQKWGVRRYRNYDGTYTQAGLKRYAKSSEAYKQANERYKTLKKEHASDGDITNARIAKKQAKRKMDKDYRHLRQDKLGDQGKELYSKGRTITGNHRTSQALSTIGGLGLTVAGYMYKEGGYPAKAINAIGGVSIAALGAAGVAEVKNAYQDKRLRAYYGHTSNY